jgi:mono/diheme cytochrome c family protein
MRTRNAGQRSEVRGQGYRPPLTSDLRPLTSYGLLIALTVTLTGCDWFLDFKRQPSVWTWEPYGDSMTVRGSPQGSVPMHGTAVAGYQVSYTPGIAQVDSLAVVPNPVPVSDSSLANGRMYYQLNCAVCHGSTGAGNGPATRFGMVPITIILDVTKNRTDGYIWGMMRNGRGLMPSYNRIEERSRWDVVNYIRALQGLVPGVTADTGALAPPGVTGDALPGATTLGPQTWIRPVLPEMKLTPRTGAPAHQPEATKHDDDGGDR